jgi:hypothetical protein
MQPVPLVLATTFNIQATARYQNLQKLWCFNQLRSAIIKCILEGKEVVSMADKDPNKLVDATAPENHIEGDKHPW